MKRILNRYTRAAISLQSVYLIVFQILLVSCQERKPSGAGSTKDLENNIIDFANRVTLIKEDMYSHIKIHNPWQGAKDIVQEWYLVGRGNSSPEGIDSSEVIYVPLKRIVCMSTTHLAMINALGETERICGFSGTRFIYDPLIRDLVTDGSISEVGYEDNINKEKIISLSPDLIMIYGIGSESAGYIGKLRELGVKTIFNADYLETHPLGKAEWIKVLGALFCREEMADSIFGELQKRYLDLSAYIESGIKDRKKVLLGMPFKDTWYISPGDSYISKLINDAGGEYLWSDTKSKVSMPMALEMVFSKAVNADFWLNIGSVTSKEEITALDSRLENLPCFVNGNLYNNNNRENQVGGNDYWESGCMSPDIILKDIASILHPELFEGYELFYYKPVR
ncbi:MAG: ABC transporter substrate-binding protein [Bacteroidales bacterium]|nr:ABC transporter substrate-binding protein [Bacteroidales bacterium]